MALFYASSIKNISCVYRAITWLIESNLQYTCVHGAYPGKTVSFRGMSFDQLVYYVL